ncbi:MAG TPA: ABC transporter permease, partial [Gemmatimonadetes bacterium]|nr:ABC transporter permease [Gemmatimonadota bacterium]
MLILVIAAALLLAVRFGSVSLSTGDVVDALTGRGDPIKRDIVV